VLNHVWLLSVYLFAYPRSLLALNANTFILLSLNLGARFVRFACLGRLLSLIGFRLAMFDCSKAHGSLRAPLLPVRALPSLIPNRTSIERQQYKTTTTYDATTKCKINAHQ